jgi:hypothetical protein
VAGIPVTSVARTLLDLSSCLSPVEFKRAFVAADRLELLDESAIAECARRDVRRQGVGEFRRHANRRLAGVDRTRSDLEALFLDLCASSGIEAPEVNATVCGFEVDCVWRGPRLIVELDGYRFHRGRESFENDADRANRLKAEGWDMLRFTWRTVTGEPGQVAGQVRSMLDRPAHPRQAVGEKAE